MPRGNKMGPQGEGPLTGRRMGYCSGSDNSGFQNNDNRVGFRYSQGQGQGFGRGRGAGQGRGMRGFGMNRTINEEEIKASINEEASLRNEIAALTDQISALEEKIEKVIKND